MLMVNHQFTIKVASLDFQINFIEFPIKVNHLCYAY